VLALAACVVGAADDAMRSFGWNVVEVHAGRDGRDGGDAGLPQAAS
jgi:hypothetical protein